MTGLNQPLMIAANWVKLAVVPDLELLWLWILTFPLTIIWMIWSSQSTKKFFNNAGGFLVFGALSMAIVLSFYGPFINVVLKLFNRVLSLLNLGSSPSLSGGVRFLTNLVKLIPLLLVIWILSMIPGLRPLVTKVLGFAWMAAGKVWNLRTHSQQNPAWYYQVAGAALIAGALNGRFVNNLTTEVAFPGLIPGISASVGLFFLFWRTVFGRKLVDRVTRRSPRAQDLPQAEMPGAPAPPATTELVFELAQMGDCPHCGKLVDLLNRGCTQCGQAFVAADSEPDQPTPARRKRKKRRKGKPASLRDAMLRR